MKWYLVFALIVGLAGAVHATDNSVEVTLELTPPEDPQGSQLRSFENWRHKPAPEESNSDANGGQWWYTFEAGSDKRLGSAADVVAIKAVVPVTVPPTIRWISRSVAAVASRCQSNVRASCLYVFEKHGSKWILTHHYRWSPSHLF